MTSHMSKFALICQAARLLGHVLLQVSRDTGIDDAMCIQLDRTLNSMLAAALDVRTPDYDQITFIYRSVSRLTKTKTSRLTSITVRSSLCIYLRLAPLMRAQQKFPLPIVQEQPYNSLPRR